MIIFHSICTFFIMKKMSSLFVIFPVYCKIRRSISTFSPANLTTQKYFVFDYCIYFHKN